MMGEVPVCPPISWSESMWFAYSCATLSKPFPIHLSPFPPPTRPSRSTQYESDIAKAKSTVSKGMADMSETRSAVHTAAADVAAAQKAVEAAKSKLEEKLMAQHKLKLK